MHPRKFAPWTYFEKKKLDHKMFFCARYLKIQIYFLDAKCTRVVKWFMNIIKIALSLILKTYVDNVYCLW